jgi:Rrf2 family protein
MKLSRAVAYALQATLQLAQQDMGVPVPCRRLAVKGKMPEAFLLQILGKLAAHGILNSTRGVEGGYALGRPAEGISLLEIIEATDGPIAAVLPLGEGLPAEIKSKLEEALSEVAERCRGQLQSVKLTDLLPQPAGAR